MTEQGVTEGAVREVEHRVMVSVITIHHPGVREGQCGCGEETSDWPAHCAAVLAQAEFIMWREYGLARGWYEESSSERRARLERAMARLEERRDDPATRWVERIRLGGKVEGVKLALSYVREEERG